MGSTGNGRDIVVLQVQLEVILILLMAFTLNGSGAAREALEGCRERCGDLMVPYPFGIGDSCSLDWRFNITCNDSTNPPKAYLRRGNVEVTNISLLDGELQVPQYVAKDCYDQDGSQGEDDYNRPTLSVPNFTISATKNKFTAMGCDTYAIVRGYNEEGERYTTGCMSICDRYEDINFESCSGVGCCQITSIPSGLFNISVWLYSYSNHTKVWKFNPCSFAVLAEDTQFKFSNSSFDYFKKILNFPLVLDWNMGNLTCDEAQNLEGYACKANSQCHYKNTSFGYLCQCSPGFHGNPYHPLGCQDIDECKDSNPCVNGICNNIFGSFNCSCEKGYTPINNQTTCVKDNSGDGLKRAMFVYISLGVSIGLITLLTMSLMICWGIRKRKFIKLKEKFFEQNGGLMLQQRLSSERGPFESTKIFTAEELKRATNNYHESRIVGEGGYGRVYTGILADNKVVAIKKSKFGVEVQTEQFINEVMVLMQINHRNVVRLLGCCLETEVPLLVYEFITNGTLFQHIHNKDAEATTLSWELRLKIAAEIAGALAYLHYETNTPIIHRDVKTMNILLDENYSAKVSDFGTSRLVPLDQDELSTLVQGTIGYLDPEYLQSSQLTEKSDVYSFGVVLAELLTGKKAFSFDKSKGVSNPLAMFFLSLKDDDHLQNFIDNSIDIVSDGNMEALIEVSNLTKRCLRIKGEERPTMKEVAMELEGILRASEKHPWGKVDHFHAEETEYLLGAPSPSMDPYNGFEIEQCGSSSATVVYDSMQSQLILMPYDDGR